MILYRSKYMMAYLQSTLSFTTFEPIILTPEMLQQILKFMTMITVVSIVNPFVGNWIKIKR